MEDVIVIGAGVVGAFLARELSKYKLNVLVLEKENDVGNVTSMANSAIVHSGYDPKPGTNKAKFNVLGNAMYPSICRDLDVEFLPIGSLTLASEKNQLPMLKELAERAKINGVEAKLLNEKEVHEEEPCLSENVCGGLLCPSAGIVNPFTLVAHAFENAIDNGVKLLLNEEVIDIKKTDNGFSFVTKDSRFESKIVINAAGLASAKIASMIEPIDWEITPRKGEYFVLDHFAWSYAKHTLFPLPSEKGKGVLFSMTTSGNYIVGPSSEPSAADDLSTDTLTLQNIKEQASLMVKDIPWREQIRTFSGVRATCTRHDFVIEPSKKYREFINLSGIESPGLVSSPAIGKYVVEELVGKIIKLEAKDDWNPKVRKHCRIFGSTDKEIDDLIKKDPDYGVIVCHCEKISLGEIKDALSRSLPCNSLKALKKRTRAGMGKCQGGFCQALNILSLAKSLGVPPSKVPYDEKGTNIVKGRTK